MFAGQGGEVIGKGGPAMDLESGPRGELGRHQVETFVDRAAILLELEVVYAAIAAAGWQPELQGPFMFWQRIWGWNRDGISPIDSQLVGARTDGPACQEGAVHWPKAGIAAQAGTAELTQHLVALGIYPQGAAKQFQTAFFIKKGADHHAAGAGWQVAAVVP